MNKKPADKQLSKKLQLGPLYEQLQEIGKLRGICHDMLSLLLQDLLQDLQSSPAQDGGNAEPQIYTLRDGAEAQSYLAEELKESLKRKTLGLNSRAIVRSIVPDFTKISGLILQLIKADCSIRQILIKDEPIDAEKEEPKYPPLSDKDREILLAPLHRDTWPGLRIVDPEFLEKIKRR